MREISPQALRAGKGCTRVRELVRRGASAGSFGQGKSATGQVDRQANQFSGRST